MSLTASIAPSTRATVSKTGYVAWSNGDKIGVYTSAQTIRQFTLREKSGNLATFTAELTSGENPEAIAVFPYSAFKSFDGTLAQVSYPESYTYAQSAMQAPVAALVSSGTLSFNHLGGLISVNCSDVPADAASFHLTALGRRITGSFYFVPEEGMSVNAGTADEGHTVTVSFTPGTAQRCFNIPVPSGTYPSFEAGFYNSAGSLIYSWTLLENVTVAPADMYLRTPSFDYINGTAISAESTRVGLITDANTGEGIPGIPVTDGYTYTYTDGNGVYQFVANADARCVYPSVPSAYEIPLASDGEPAFWKTGSYRNDWTLTPRTASWTDFSVIAFSDVHFWNKGDKQSEEVQRFRERTLPDINNYIATLGNKLIILNTGDVVTNVPKKLADSRAEFAKIKKGGVTVPMFPTIGNHDFNNAYTSTLACSQDWVDVYGPLDYSFNIGNVHFVCLNNLQYAGNSSGGYGKSMEYSKGLTDDQWAWLQADLATVTNKAGTMLVLCVHTPIMNTDGAHHSDIRSVLKTFAESHIISGHSHYTVHRQFADDKNGLSGRLSEEHNLNPLGGLWRSSIGNDGSPNSFHVFHISGASVSSQVFKAIGSADASLQMRVYDGAASYHSPVEDSYNGNEDVEGSGLIYFDWNTLWSQSKSEGTNTSDKLIVRVFDAGSRNLNINVYCNEGGVRTPLTPSSKTHRDQCSFSYFWNSGDITLTANWAQAYWQNRVPSWWYCTKPATSDWKIEVEFVEPSGSRWYECNTIQTNYIGFPW